MASVLLASFSGSFIASILIGAPHSALVSDYVMFTYLVVFALHRWSPADVFHRLFSWAPIAWLISGIDAMKWTKSISGGLLAAVNAEHPAARRSMATALTCGFISGCGGGMVHSALSLSSPQWKFRCPSGLASSLPSFGIRMSALLSVLFYALINPHHYLPYTPLLSNDDARLVLFLIAFSQDALASPSTWRRFKHMASLPQPTTTATTTTSKPKRNKQKKN